MEGNAQVASRMGLQRLARRRLQARCSEAQPTQSAVMPVLLAAQRGRRAGSALAAVPTAAWPSASLLFGVRLNRKAIRER